MSEKPDRVRSDGPSRELRRAARCLLAAGPERVGPGLQLLVDPLRAFAEAGIELSPNAARLLQRQALPEAYDEETFGRLSAVDGPVRGIVDVRLVDEGLASEP